MRVVRFIAVGLTVLLVVLGGVALGMRGPAASSASPPAPAEPKVRVAETWRVELQAEYVGLPATDQAGVVVTADGSQVMAISNAGKVEWTAAIEGALARAPRLDRDLVFVAAERAVVALRRADGAVAWSAPTTTTGEPNWANRPVVTGEVVVVTAADGLVLGLDRVTGAERWRVTLPTATTAEPAAQSAASARPVVVVVGIAEWRALDPVTGATLWSADIGLFGTSSPVVYAEGEAVTAAIATNERLLAVDALTGAPKWDVPAEQSELYQVPVFAPSESQLLVPDHWGRLASYDPRNGKRLWSTRGADAVAEFGEPVLVADRLVALPLDGGGPRLATPSGSTRIKLPAEGHGVADLPSHGLVVTTWGGTENFVLLYAVSYD